MFALLHSGIEFRLSLKLNLMCLSDESLFMYFFVTSLYYHNNLLYRIIGLAIKIALIGYCLYITSD